MNQNDKVFTIIIILFAMLLIAGCAAPQASSDSQACPTAAQPSCPTAVVQSLPTAAPQVLPAMTSFQKYYSDFVNIRITFDPGKKCSMDILKPVTQGDLALEIVVNDQTYQNYIVTAMTLAEGMTIEDIEKYNQTAVGYVSPPPGSDTQTVDVVPPLSRTYHFLTMPVSPLYFVCLIQGPDKQQPIEQLGPVVIRQ
jgi:hypothetical protein